MRVTSAPARGLRIAELAELVGVSTDTVRYYERAGLLAAATENPERLPGLRARGRRPAEVHSRRPTVGSAAARHQRLAVDPRHWRLPVRASRAAAEATARRTRRRDGPPQRSARPDGGHGRATALQHLPAANARHLVPTCGREVSAMMKMNLSCDCDPDCTDPNRPCDC